MRCIWVPGDAARMEKCSATGSLPALFPAMRQTWGLRISSCCRWRNTLTTVHGDIRQPAILRSPADMAVRRFMEFVDACHAHGLGVIMDWVPGHFCNDGHGLRLLMGRPCLKARMRFVRKTASGAQQILISAGRRFGVFSSLTHYSGLTYTTLTACR